MTAYSDEKYSCIQVKAAQFSSQSLLFIAGHQCQTLGGSKKSLEIHLPLLVCLKIIQALRVRNLRGHCRGNLSVIRFILTDKPYKFSFTESYEKRPYQTTCIAVGLRIWLNL